MFTSFFLSVYLTSLLIFCMINHPVGYCILLLTSAASVSGFVYCVVGFSWYLVLFCLVYVGGVYTLFIFVSVHSPNLSVSVGSSIFVTSCFFICFLFISYGGLGGVPVFVECSHYLCSYFEGFTYSLFCLILMLGFVCISVVVGEKDSFFR